MGSNRSAKLRRIVGVAGVAAGCVVGVVTVLTILTPDLKPSGEATPTFPLPSPEPPTVGGGGGSGGGGGGGEDGPTVDELLADLKSANAAFNSPTSMHLDDSTEVELLVSRERGIGELQSELDQAGELEGEEIRVSDTMEAQLSGVGFAIEPITPAVQLVAGEGVTRWKWAVEATEAGEQRLHLTLSALLSRDGQDRQYTIRTFARTLDVEVTLQDRLGDFLGGNWQWLWAALLAPFVGWALRHRRHRKAEETPPTALQP